MKAAHIANTNAEFEYACPFQVRIEESLLHRTPCLQLQFLPLLYASTEDLVAVTHLPPAEYLVHLEEMGWGPGTLPCLVLLEAIEPFEGKECLPWASSPSVCAWADERRMAYPAPTDWNRVAWINSKAFSFHYSSLEASALLTNERELRYWMREIEGAKVLKTCFGLSANGNRVTHDAEPSARILAFCRKEWTAGRPLIGEPWLEKVVDFSSQWFIDSRQGIRNIGITRFETDERGAYQATLAGPESILFASLEMFLKNHLERAQRCVEDIAKLGFFGSVGIDALLYRDRCTQAVRLYPIVEINARQTLSLAALRLQKRLCPDQLLRLSFQSTVNRQRSLLPEYLTLAGNKKIVFKKKLTLQFLFEHEELQHSNCGPNPRFCH